MVAKFVFMMVAEFVFIDEIFHDNDEIFGKEIHEDIP
jgi:hypothetical protein